MNIKTLHVQNFKNFEDKTFEFSEGFNLIIGDNGTGKTAILEALSVALGGFLVDIDTAKSRTFEREEVRVQDIKQGQTYVPEEQYPVKVTAKGEVIGRAIEWTRTLEKFTGKTTTKQAKPIREIASELTQQVRAGESVTLPVVAYYSTGRLWLRKSDTLKIEFEELSPTSRLVGYTDALDTAINNILWLRWFARVELISLQKTEPMKVSEAVKKAVRSCIEGCEQVFFDIHHFEVITKIHGNLLPFYLLSDGQRTMVAMVFDLASRMAQLNPHLLENVTLETPGVVLIDELDLHLHPKWQRTIVENLRKTFPKVQFIATSHSPFIIQSLRPGELIDLNEVEGAAQFQNQSIEDIVEKVQGVDLPQLSERKQQMFDAATEYYKVLEKAKAADSVELEHLKSKLDELIMPFSEDMAYQAFLKMERLAAIGEKD